MKKFIIHYRAPAEAMARMVTATALEKSEGIRPWMDWKERVGDQLIDFGTPLMGAYRINSSGDESSEISDITGYSIIEANNLTEAKSLLDEHPHLKWSQGCSIEVFECIDI